MYAYILDRLEILYQMVYENQKKIFYFIFALRASYVNLKTKNCD
jgi:hypothetical protein